MADQPSAVNVYALDVGQGDCTFVVDQRRDHGVILFDCNDAYVAERFVVDHGITTLHAAVISHLDRDHIQGFLPFLRWFLSDPSRTLKRVVIGKDRAQDEIREAGAELIRTVLDWEKQYGFEILPPHTGPAESIVWETSTWSARLVLPRYARLLHDEWKGDDEPNRRSVALRIVCGSNVVMLGGDVPLVSWEGLAPELLRCGVFRAPHHGGGIDEGASNWNERTLYDTAQPESVVVSVGTKRTSHGATPHRYRAREAPVAVHTAHAALPQRRRRSARPASPRGQPGRLRSLSSQIRGRHAGSTASERGPMRRLDPDRGACGRCDPCRPASW